MLVKGKVIRGTPWYNLAKTWRYLPSLGMNEDDFLEVFDRLKPEAHD